MGTAMAHGHNSDGRTSAPCASRTIDTMQVVGASSAHSRIPRPRTRTRALRSSSWSACSACLSIPNPPATWKGPNPAATIRVASGSVSGTWPCTHATER
jgi:hypothetical protein